MNTGNMNTWNCKNVSLHLCLEIFLLHLWLRSHIFAILSTCLTASRIFHTRSCSSSCVHRNFKLLTPSSSHDSVWNWIRYTKLPTCSKLEACKKRHIANNISAIKNTKTWLAIVIMIHWYTWHTIWKISWQKFLQWVLVLCIFSFSRMFLPFNYTQNISSSSTTKLYLSMLCTLDIAW